MSAESLDEEAIETAVAAYRRDGIARLGERPVADPATLEALRARADAIMLGEVVHEGLFFQHDSPSGRYEDLTLGDGFIGPSLAYRKIEKLERDPIFRAWIENEVFERVVRRVIDGPVVLYRAVLFNKAASGGTELPFHQDGGNFWGLDRDPILQLWTALDDAPIEAGCLEVIPGSHAPGLATRLGGVIPDDIVRARLDGGGSLVKLPARAGDVLLVHNHLFHRSGRNVTGVPRRALTVCYMTAETRCLRKKRAPRVFVPVFRGKDGA